MPIDETHSIRFSFTLEQLERNDTDSEYRNFSTANVSRAGAWVSQFAGREDVRVCMEINLRSTESVLRFLHLWAEYGEELKNATMEE